MLSYLLLKKYIKKINTQLNELKILQTEQTKKIANLLLLNAYQGKTINEAYKNFYLHYPKATGFLCNVQRCNLKLMAELKNVCETLGIKFWLHAGTLIGALRHQGFIPWDDDVDVAMTVDDFNTLKAYLDKNKINLVLNEYYNQLTCSRQYQLKFNNDKLPIFIDIVKFTTCNARTNEEKIKFNKKKEEAYKKMLHQFQKKLHSPKIIDIGYYMLGKYDSNTKIKVDHIINEANKKLEEKNLIKNPSWYYAIENYPFPYPILNNEDMFPLKIVKFNDLEFYIPNKPEKYLSGYGNIWDLPRDIGNTPHLYAFINKKMEIEQFAKE